jgi:two-component system CheB/CheR fusion protein
MSDVKNGTRKTGDELAAQKALEQKARELEREVAVRREMESRLILAMEVAEAASASKSDFLASISHELRTPMAAIMASTQLLRNSVEGDRNREALDIIWRASHSMASLIENLIDFARSESGRLKLEENVFDLEETFREWVIPFAARARDKGVHLTFDYLVSEDEMLVGDNRRIQQILGSILDNALKYTPNGNVQCEVWDEDATIHELTPPRDSICLHFSVSDTGIGIRSDQMESVFEPLANRTAAAGPIRNGPGLGLAIARQLVELMDGKIWVESEPEKGSTFHFVIQLTRAKRVPVKARHRSWAPIGLDDDMD